MDFPATQKYTTPCGTQFDVRLDRAVTAFLCDNWARWEFRTDTAMYLYACNSHTSRVLKDISNSIASNGIRNVSVKDLRTL